MQKGKKAGFTLLEMVITMAILLIVMAPMLNMFVTSTRINANAHKISIATFTAQLKMEELIGLNEDELDAVITSLEGSKNIGNYNGYTVALIRRDINNDAAYEFPEALVEITVEVYELDTTNLLCRQTNLINIAIGGIL